MDGLVELAETVQCPKRVDRRDLAVVGQDEFHKLRRGLALFPLDEEPLRSETPVLGARP